MKTVGNYRCVGKNDITFFDDYIINNYDDKNEKIKLVNKDYNFKDFDEIKGYYIMNGTDTSVSIRSNNIETIAVLVNSYTFELDYNIYQDVSAINEEEAWELIENCGYDIVGIVED